MAQPHGQSGGKDDFGIVQGTVRDEEKRPLANVTVFLRSNNNVAPAQNPSSISDSKGHFQFVDVPPDSYLLSAKLDGYELHTEGPFVLSRHETKSIDLTLTKAKTAESAKDANATIPFSDEPQFTVAGVTDTSALGVHAASRSLPNSNALAKDTAALAREGANPPNLSPRTGAGSTASEEAALRAKLAEGESADVRFQLAEIEESAGHSLEAVRDYERAAKLQPTESHIFAWGAELLLHRAFEPAIEVFTKGRQRYPQSVLMLLGLGATRYAQGSREEAAQVVLEASDLDPSNPQPYLFLGRMLATENLAPPDWVERMKRFANLEPENAMAHYFYAVALTKQNGGAESAAAAESQLNTALELDPHFGNAYLQLGILYSGKKDFPRAVAALQKAVEYTPLPDEAHYRLAEVYRRMGEADKARQETALYKQISAQKAEETERERHEIQQFIYTLRGQAAPAPSTPSPH